MFKDLREMKYVRMNDVELKKKVGIKLLKPKNYTSRRY